MPSSKDSAQPPPFETAGGDRVPYRQRSARRCAKQGSARKAHSNSRHGRKEENGMTRRDFFAALPAATPRPERRNRKEHHAGERVFHGPMVLPDYVLDSAGRAAPLRTTHRHPVLRVARDGITYLFRSQPSPEMVGEIWRTPEGQYRVHVWSCAVRDGRNLRVALELIERDRLARMPAEPTPLPDDYAEYFAVPIMPPPRTLEPLDGIAIRRVPLEALED